MAIATATSIDLYAGGKLLFADVSFKLEPRERMTLSGRNGVGKSTLLRVLAGARPPDPGSIALPKGARVASPARRPPRDDAISLSDYVFSGRADMEETEAELARLEAAMGAGTPDEETMRAYSVAQQRAGAGGGRARRGGGGDGPWPPRRGGGAGLPGGPAAARSRRRLPLARRCPRRARRPWFRR